jgi:hypothetical protein
MFGQSNGQARNEIDVSLDKLAKIILLARAYEAGRGDENELQVTPGSSSNSGHGAKGQVPRGLLGAIDAMSEDEQAVLVALSLIGHGDFGAQEFDQALTIAFDRRGGVRTSDYLLGLPMLADLLENGAVACGAVLGTEEHASTRPNGAIH